VCAIREKGLPTTNPNITSSNETGGGSIQPVDEDLWASLYQYLSFGDHALRYLFARQFCKGAKVLDWGCGYGFGAALLSSVCSQYVGVDVLKRQIDWATRCIAPKYSFSSFYESRDFFRLFATHQFDVVLLFEVIEHVDNPLQLLSEVKEQLKRDGGILFVSTPNGAFSKHNPRLFTIAEHRAEFCPDELRGLLLKAGFSRIKSYKEYRPDRLDSCRRAFQVMKRMMTSHGPDPAIGGGGYEYLLRRMTKVIDGPEFWRINEMKSCERNLPIFTTHLAVASLESHH